MTARVCPDTAAGSVQRTECLAHPFNVSFSMQNPMTPTDDSKASVLDKVFALMRALARAPAEGAKITQLAQDTGLSQGTAHRLMRALVEQGVVEQDSASKRYRLGLELFRMASTAGSAATLRDIFRPALLRLSGTLKDTIFLLVRSNYDAVCIDRSDGPYPIRSFTGDIGGSIALGVGQGSLAILASLPPAEQDEVIRFNLPRLKEYRPIDEVFLRTEIARARELGYVATQTGLIEGMAGLAVPVFDASRRPVAALSVGTIADRLTPERLPVVAAMLKKEADALGPLINPFDPTVRRPANSFIS